MKKNRTKRSVVAIVFGLFGIAFAVAVFVLTDNWPRRLHALIIGAINIGAAVYLGRTSNTTRETTNPNQAPEDTTYKLADPQH